MPEPLAVTLRGPDAADLDVLFRLAADLDTWEERRPSSPAPLSRAAFDARSAQAEAADAAEEQVRLVVDLDGAAVGSVTLFGFDRFAGHAEVGIALLPEARGRGVGTAALLQLVEFAFVRCNLRRLHLQGIASNVGALRAYEKAGFVVEGRLREHAWVRGAYEDVVLMGVGRPAVRTAPRPALHLLGVHHVAVICTDYERSKRFYLDVLGFALRKEVFRAERDSWMADLTLHGRYVLELFSFPDPPARPTAPEATGLRHLAFEVDDVAAAVEAMRHGGVRCEDVRIDPHTGKRMAFFFDPDEQPLELYER